MMMGCATTPPPPQKAHAGAGAERERRELSGGTETGMGQYSKAVGILDT